MVMDNLSDDMAMRLETMRWIEDQFKLIIDLVQNVKLSDIEKKELTATYRELERKMRREKAELIRLGKI